MNIYEGAFKRMGDRKAQIIRPQQCVVAYGYSYDWGDCEETNINRGRAKYTVVPLIEQIESGKIWKAFLMVHSREDELNWEKVRKELTYKPKEREKVIEWVCSMTEKYIGIRTVNYPWFLSINEIYRGACPYKYYYHKWLWMRVFKPKTSSKYTGPFAYLKYPDTNFIDGKVKDPKNFRDFGYKNVPGMFSQEEVWVG
jgi:hypothetical protein